MPELSLKRCFLVRVKIGEVAGKPLYQRIFTVVSNLAGEPVQTEAEAKQTAAALLPRNLEFALSRRVRLRKRLKTWT